MKNSGWVLRPATYIDHDSIAEVWHASASLQGVGPPEMPTVADLRRRVDAEMASEWKVTVADQSGDVIGFAAIKPNDAVLDQLFVQPGLIGGGLGRALLEHCMRAMPHGFTLHTASSNNRACKFYEKAGLRFLRYDAHPRTGHPVSYYSWNP
jgi:ribosomal protein S18 acetylase RimI-like enzyme